MTEVDFSALSPAPHPINRFYLHHHSPSHHGKKLGSFKRHMSVSSFGSLFGGLHMSAKSHKSPSKNKIKFMSAVNLGDQDALGGNFGSSADSSAVNCINGHYFVEATCSRLKQRCETCQHSVHAHAYLYCQNCPVVIHNKMKCQAYLRRLCPAKELGVKGWGEGSQIISYDSGQTLDLETVFLSGMLGLQSNKCYECDCVLDKTVGHELATNRADTAGQSESSDLLMPKYVKHSNKHNYFNYLGLRRGKMHLNQANHDDVVLPPITAMRICHMTGKYYCNRCHWNDEWYVPGSLFLLNDTQKHPVCRSIYLKLLVLWDTVIYRLPGYWNKENVHAMQVYEMRTRLIHLSRYAMSCPTASSIKADFELKEHVHLLEKPSYLRMFDVVEVINDTLYPRLMNYYKIWSEHITICSKCANIRKSTKGDYDDENQICFLNSP